MSKKNRKRREAARRQEEQRRAKLVTASESPEEDAAEAPEDEASRVRRRAEQKREYEKRKQQKARGNQSLAPFFWGGGIVGVIAVIALGGFVLLSGGDSGGGAAAPSATPDPRIAGLPIDRTINIQTDDDGQSANPRFIPSTISAEAGEVIEIVVTNVGSVAHNLHFPGLDALYDTRDDWLVDPPTLQPGDTGRVVVKIDDPGSNPFRCDFHALTHLGRLTLS